MKVLKLTALLIFNILLMGCDEASQRSHVDSTKETNIATYPIGGFTVDELNNYIVNNSIQIQLTSENLMKKYTDIVHDAVIEKQMLYEAELAGIKELYQYKIKYRDLRNNLFTNQFLKTNNLNITFNNDELEQYYDDNKNQYNLPEVRSVYHLFKSKTSVNPKQEIEELRERMISGESFKALAEKYSDSETRHKKGFLGKLNKGNFSNEFDEIIFNLVINQPSPVITTNDGYHIFLVTDKLNEKKYELHEIKGIVSKDFISELTVNVIKEQALQLDNLPDPLRIVSEEEFKTLVLNKNLEAKVFEIGKEKLLLREFIYLKQELSKRNPTLNYQDNLYKVFEETAYSEVIYQYMLKQDVELNQQKYFNTMTSKMILEEFREIKLKSYINKKPELITEYFKTNKLRYVTPIKLNIEILSIPISQKINLMPELETLISQLDENNLSLTGLAKKYNGKVIMSGMLNKKQLSQYNQNINRFLSTLDLNKHSPPFTNNGFYTIIKLLDKTKPEVNPLPIVREEVVRDYINNYKAQIFKEIAQEYINSIQIKNDVLSSYIHNLRL